MGRLTYSAVVALSMVLHTDFAASHAVLVSSVPAASAVLKEAPREIRLTFNQPVELRFSKLTVTRREGNKVQVGPVSSDTQERTNLVVAVPTLQPGHYQVHWEATSSDSHRIQGDFDFEIRP
jgi:methionine-rich copper-binding protein CopC